MKRLRTRSSSTSRTNWALLSRKGAAAAEASASAGQSSLTLLPLRDLVHPLVPAGSQKHGKDVAREGYLVRARHAEMVDGDLQHDVVEADHALDLGGVVGGADGDPGRRNVVDRAAIGQANARRHRPVGGVVVPAGIRIEARQGLGWSATTRSRSRPAPAGSGSCPCAARPAGLGGPDTRRCRT